MKKTNNKKTYKKPTVLAATRQGKNFSSGCMGGLAQCIHCRQL